MNESLYLITFGAFALTTIGAACWLALTRRLVYAAFLLFAVLLAIAGLFVFAGAEFPAVSQIIVYVGGILILIMFGIMLTHKDLLIKAKESQHYLPQAGLTLALLGVLFSPLLVWVYERPSEALPPAGDSVPQIGIQTLSSYLLPFEVLGILLLVALVGAASLARRDQ